MSRIKIGFFELTNPYNQKKTIVSASPNDVHSIVFWSKNYRQFIQGKFGEKLKTMGYGLFFQFTLNSESEILEPNIPSLSERSDQIEYLCKTFSPQVVRWRFDPICFYRSNDKIQNNLADFETIAFTVAQYGINSCTTSFMDHYRKIKRRTENMPSFDFIDLSLNEKLDILSNMENVLQPYNIKLLLCCENDISKMLPSNSNVRESSCVPNDQLMLHYGGRLNLGADTGQRIAEGCRCKISKDIGSYSYHPCNHKCLYCYANK